MNPKARIKPAARKLIARAASRVGLDVVPSTFYSPIPRIPSADDQSWLRESGFPVDVGAQMTFIERDLAAFLSELPEGLRPAEENGFTIWNGQYQAGDAELLYAVIRYLRPRRVLELGSGFSTLVSAAACAANESDGNPAELVAVDPEPRTRVPADMRGLARIELVDSRLLPIERFLELKANDVLFIDTSHIVKLGGEVNELILEVLPRLAPGVWVHVHDVFIPFEYPKYLFDLGVYFTEQYLLQAFLQDNPHWEVTIAAAALKRKMSNRLGALIPSVAEGHPDAMWADALPAAFWIRRLPDPPTGHPGCVPVSHPNERVSDR